MLLTSSDNYLRGVVVDRPAYNIAKDQCLHRDTEQLVCEVLRCELEMTRALNKHREALETRYDFSTKAAFDTIDQLSNNYVDSFALAAFLGKQNYHAT